MDLIEIIEVEVNLVTNNGLNVILYLEGKICVGRNIPNTPIHFMAVTLLEICVKLDTNFTLAKLTQF